VRLGAPLAPAAPIGVTVLRAPLVIGGLFAIALGWGARPLVLGSPANARWPASHRPTWAIWQTGRNSDGRQLGQQYWASLP